MNIKKIALLGVILMGSALAFAQESFLESVPEEYRNRLLETGSVLNINEESDNEYHVLPECDYTELIRANRVQKTTVPFVAEQMYYITKEELGERLNKEPVFDVSDAAEIFSSVSKMTGMKYFSTTRKREMVLYKDVHFVSGPNEKEEVPDYENSETDGLQYFALLHDASFGPNIYQMDYHQSDSALYVRVTNKDSMRFGFVKAVKPEDLILSYLIVDCGDSFLVYLATDVNMKKFPGMRKQVADSLVSRLTAVYNWFLDQF